MKILTYKELIKLPAYEGQVSKKGYNTLIKAYECLPTLVKKLNLDCNMRDYGGKHYLTKEEVKHECRTVACLMGAIAMLYPNKSQYFDGGEFCYLQFQEDRIPLITDKPYLDIGGDEVWHFLFSGNWNRYQDTFDQGIERIGIFLSGNYNPKWNYTKANPKFK